MAETLPIRVLILEDHPSDADLMLDELKQAGFAPDVQYVETEADYLARLQPSLDLILAAYTLPQFDALAALHLLQTQGLDIPFIIVSSSIGEEQAVILMQQGASDYLLKVRLARLGDAVKRALQEKQLRDEKRQIEETLRQNEVSFRYLFAHNPLAMWVFDVETLVFLDVNEAAIAHYGYSHAEFLTMRITDIQPAADAPQLLDHIVVPRPPLQISDGWRHRLKDGRVIDVEIASHAMEFGQRKAILVVSQDITERRRAEAVRQLLAALVESSDDAIFGKTVDGMITSWNAGAERLYGYTAEEMVGNPVTMLMPSDRANDFPIIMDKIRAGERIGHYETVRQRKDGTRLDISLSVSPIKDNDGKVIGASAIAHDITEQKRVHAEMLKAELLSLEQEKERGILKLKEQFISTVSHDFRTPLSVIQVSRDLLENYFDRITPEMRQHYLHEIQTQINYMIELLNDVMEVGAAQAGKLQFNPLELELIPFCKRILEQMRLTDTTNHQFIFDAQGSFQGIMLDDNLLRRILLNLLSNAIKYSAAGSEVRLELRDLGREIVFRLRDQGIGIPASDLKGLFEAFHRAENATKIKGTGLGLTIVKNCVDAHGGTISVESTEGVGTIFTFRLPRSVANM